MRIGDLLPYLPLASAVLVGLVAAWFGRNGWKWATLTFFAAFAVFFLAITPLNKSAAEVLKALPFVVLVLAALLARRLWGRRRNRSGDSTSKHGSLILGGTLVVVLLAALCAPLLLELQTIGSVRDNYYLENAVYKETISRHKPTAEQFLNPSFLKKYNLSISDYEDSNGYFAPNGHHWNKWSIETRIAAILLFSADEEKLSRWKIHQIIHSVDDYYTNNDKSVAVVDVISAILHSASRIRDRANTIDQLRRAGFSDDEINQWLTADHKVPPCKDESEACKPPAECATAKNAGECAETLKKLGKSPFDAFGSIGSEPVYGRAK
jgi:hypothetical protein